ncbi:hypothetical protein HYW44_02815, partial [Candidatus Daviesbacteria bacterium]|nr:hypothetical protein [Candidatus Daviesbacteria bacterium]
SSLTYCLYITFTTNVKYYLALASSGSITPFIFLKPELALIAGIGFLISLSIAYFNLSTNLKTYVNFAPVNLLSSPIKTLNTLMLLSLTLVFYFHSNTIIQTRGFKLPEPIIDWAIDLSMQGANIPVKGEKYLAQLPTLSQEQINLLKQNPEILKQYGLDPKDLDELIPNENSGPDIKSPNQSAVKITPSLPTANLKDIIKAQITDSLDQIIKPYLLAIPIILAFLFYSLVSFALWILSFFLSPAILLIFFILEKTGFIKFEKETREVRKLVV